jgi:hypothetical protein
MGEYLKSEFMKRDRMSRPVQVKLALAWASLMKERWVRCEMVLQRSFPGRKVRGVWVGAGWC